MKQLACFCFSTSIGFLIRDVDARRDIPLIIKYIDSVTGEDIKLYLEYLLFHVGIMTDEEINSIYQKITTNSEIRRSCYNEGCIKYLDELIRILKKIMKIPNEDKQKQPQTTYKEGKIEKYLMKPNQQEIRDQVKYESEKKDKIEQIKFLQNKKRREIKLNQKEEENKPENSQFKAPKTIEIQIKTIKDFFGIFKQNRENLLQDSKDEVLQTSLSSGSKDKNYAYNETNNSKDMSISKYNYQPSIVNKHYKLYIGAKQNPNCFGFDSLFNFQNKAYYNEHLLLQ